MSAATPGATPHARFPAAPTEAQVREAAAHGRRAAIVGIFAGVLLATVKIFAGWRGDSFALLADGVESVLDVFASFAVWGGLRMGASPRTARFPYGLGKVEPLASLAVATVLLVASAALTVGAVSGILSPNPAPEPYTLAVLVGVVAVKEVLFRRLSTTAARIGSQALHADAWHHRADAVTSLAAFVGISIALVGGPELNTADEWAALVACAVIAVNGIRLFGSSVREVLDVQAPREVEERVREIARGVEGVVGIDVCRVRKSGLVYLVDIHVEVDGGITVQEGHEIGHRVKDALHGSDLAILDALAHVEPARGDPDGDGLPGEVG